MNSREIYKQIILIENELNNLLITKEKFKFRPDLWEKEKIEDILKAFRGGESIGSIARYYKTSHPTIKDILLSHDGGNMSPEEFERLIQQHKSERPDLWEPQNVEDMLKRFRDGESLYSIANDEVYHAGDKTIKKILLSPSGGNMSEEEFKKLSQQHRTSELRSDLRKPEKIEDILKAFRGGESIGSIAKHYEATYDTIRRILLSPSGGNVSEEEFKKLSQQNNKYESRFDLWEKEKIEDMLKRFRDGEPLSLIAKHYEATYDTIRRILLSPSGGNMSPEEFKKLSQQNNKYESRPDLWETEKIEDMLKRFRGGESLGSIANDKVYKTDNSTIKYILLDPSGGNMSPEEFERLIQQHRNESRPDLWETEKIEDMLKTFRGGESLSSIAKVYDTVNRTIKRILLDPSGGNMSPEEFNRLAQQNRNELRPDLWEPKNVEDMLKRFRNGESLRSIAGHYETTYDAIKRILSRNMSPEEYNEILSRRSMGSRIKRGPKGSRITPEDPNADPVNTYSSRATGDDPVLSGPTRDPIAEAVEEVIKGSYKAIKGSYIAIVLSPESRRELIDWWNNSVGIDLLDRTIAHHMTLKYQPDEIECQNYDIGSLANVKVIGYVADEKAQAVAVECQIESQNRKPHITVSVSVDTMPVYSNKLLSNKPIIKCNGPVLSGEIKYLLPRLN